ncbi:MAG: SpoIIE family protein phosphatase [Oscillospiraceae bacterium]|nr:SpoIIE family protein phosphatase [Oscillospiraceae bacterium]
MNGVGTQRRITKKWVIRHRNLSAKQRLLRDSVLMLCGGFVLAGIRVFGAPMPIGACFVLSVPFGVCSLTAMLGAAGGYLALFGVDAAPDIALALMMFSAAAVFQGTELPLKKWFFPSLSASVFALLDGITFFGGNAGNPTFLAAKILIAALSTAALRSSFRGSRKAQLFLLASVCAGISGLTAAVNLGLILATACCVATGDPAVAAAMGIALDLGSGFSGGMTVAAVLPALICYVLQRREKLSVAITYLVLTNLTLLLFGANSFANALCVFAGVGAGVLLWQGRIQNIALAASPQRSAATTLRNAAEVLEYVHGCLQTDGATPVSEAEEVYDGAAERVCRCCARFHRCWEYRAQETYSALSDTAKQMIEKGFVEADDLPDAFREQCCHVEGFVTAVNQELEGMLYRRRYRMELHESRQAVADELSCIAKYLRAESDPQRRERSEAAYAPEVGISSVGKNGSRISGDRGTCFTARNLEYYVILCDGMGTGEEAAQCSGDTLRLLERLLRSGIAPEEALQLLNSSEILRGATCFATVDLLQVDLTTGEAAIYKWGAAASYLRDGEEVKKIGTATTPPGVGVGGEHAPERYELSLKGGELLVLVSDGAGGMETEANIAAFRGDSPQELAALLIAGLPAEDDMTAVAISLRPCTSR